MASETSSSLPPTSALAILAPSALPPILDILFEPSPTLHTLVHDAPPPPASLVTYASLIAHIRTHLLSLASAPPPSQTAADDTRRGTLHAILGSHPRLGAKRVDSAQSAAEQAQLQGGGGDEAARLAGLNARYEEAFPGLRYVVFVNGRGRDVIMQDMEARIARGDARAEEREAIEVSWGCGSSPLHGQGRLDECQGVFASCSLTAWLLLDRQCARLHWIACASMAGTRAEPR